jgi:hypothetical protein
MASKAVAAAAVVITLHKNMLGMVYSSVYRTLHGYTPHLVSAKVREDPCGHDLDHRLTYALRCGLFDSAETVASLQAFRKRHADAQRVHGQLSSQSTNVDFTYYRSILKNQNIVNEAEKLLKDFKPVTYDANTHVKAIEAFEEKAASLPPHIMALDFVNASLQSHPIG